MRKDARRRRLVIAAALALSLCAAHAASLDGLHGLLLQAVARDGSEWSATYSATGFWRVKRGMTADEVVALVGEPIERYEVPRRPGFTGWRWTRNPDDTHYKVRVVLFDESKVVERISGFHLD
jgi:outer membrane protein assembly factor BamE (lipoprotein component of BamABCDE complex)